MLKIRKTFKYRLYPNRKQGESLLATLDVCRYLYNDALQERREAWKLCRKSITFAMQSAQLPACKKPMQPCEACIRRYFKMCCTAWIKRTRRSFAVATVSRDSRAKAGSIPSPIRKQVSVWKEAKYHYRKSAM